MKKIISIITVLCILVSLTACGDKNTAVPDGNAPSDNEDATSYSEAPVPTELSPQINSSTEISTDNRSVQYPISPEAMVVKGEEGGATPTGLRALSKTDYTASEKREGLSEKKLSHSHGPASGGRAHHTVEAFQDTFDEFSASTLDRVTEEKVMYLTFDCGYEYDNLTSDILDTLREKQVPAAFFCTLDHIKTEPELIARMINEGHIVGNHSATHPSFAEISREQMAEEIEETENYLRENFGYCAKYFRFPAGEYTESALDLVASLGYVSVFWSVAYDDWNTQSIKGKEYAVDTVTSRFHDGAIILLHSVSHDNAEALGEIIDRARAEGYEFRSLEQLPL